MCDDGTRAHESSFWDLLKPELQHSIIELALELRRSEAREKYQTIRSLDFGFRWVEDFALPLHWDNMVSELEELVQEIRAAEQCFGVLSAQENEMAELQASLQKIVNPEPWVFDFGDLDFSDLFSDLDAQAEGL